VSVIDELPPPPDDLVPDSFAERMYVSLGPLALWDPDYQWSLLILQNAIGQMFQLIEDWVRDTAAGPGWSLLLDVNRCPDEALSWLAQFVGVRLLPGSTPDEQRARIASTDGFKRGTRAAMIGAAQATLTGGKTVIFRERDGANMGHPSSPDYAYCLTVITYVAQTPDATATKNALLAQKPGGIVLDYHTNTGQDWQTVKTGNATWQTVKTKYATWGDVLVAAVGG